MTQPIRKIVAIEFTDSEVFAAIRGDADCNTRASSWFFKKARGYAIGTWQKRFHRLQEGDWDIILSNVDAKIVERTLKGLQLKEGTRLTSYYATVAEYAILDYLSAKKKEQTHSLDTVFIPTVELPPNNLEKKELAIELKSFLEKVTKNKEQVQVLLLFAKGYSYRDIVEKTSYNSEGACRNAYVKTKKKISAYIEKYPEEGKALRKLLQTKF